MHSSTSRYNHVCTHNYSILVHIHTQGCFTAIPLAFILPTASYLKLSKTKWCSRGKLVALAVLILGVIVMFIGTGLAIKKVSYNLVFIAVVHSQFNSNYVREISSANIIPLSLSFSCTQIKIVCAKKGRGRAWE